MAGVEYTFYQINESATDIGILVEYLHDARDQTIATTPPTAFDDDIFIGTRLALNDVQDSSALAGAIIDIDDQSTIFFVEAERRLGDKFKVEVEGRFFINIKENISLKNFENDSFITLRLSYFFN